MRRWANVGLMLAQRHRRWANSQPTLAQRHMFAGLNGIIFVDFMPKMAWTIGLPFGCQVALELTSTCIGKNNRLRKTHNLFRRHK